LDAVTADEEDEAADVEAVVVVDDEVSDDEVEVEDEVDSFLVLALVSPA
jgi:hypothetical protein